MSGRPRSVSSAAPGLGGRQVVIDVLPSTGASAGEANGALRLAQGGSSDTSKRRMRSAATASHRFLPDALAVASVGETMTNRRVALPNKAQLLLPVALLQGRNRLLARELVVTSLILTRLVAVVARHTPAPLAAADWITR